MPPQLDKLSSPAAGGLSCKSSAASEAPSGGGAEGNAELGQPQNTNRQLWSSLFIFFF